ncbi:hypothetical protein AB0I45_11750 [Brevibacterium sp. NPDC049920]|uniref:hypothetical protein n=1 Tax=Brevibacterium sp. NPDC049920 TaxID=3155279 RepID=UPI0033D949A3
MSGISGYQDVVDGIDDPVRCIGKRRKAGYLPRRVVAANDHWIDRWKVLISRSNNIGTELNDDNQNAFVVEPGSVCTETYIVVGADLELDESTALNLVAYMKSV